MSGPSIHSAERRIARARANLGTDNDRVAISSGHHDRIADEPAALGGRDAGPAPSQYLLSGLGACTAMTSRIYAERKRWDLREMEVSMCLVEEGKSQQIDRVIALEGEVSDEQRIRLAHSAERTPVTLMLKPGVAIATTLRPADCARW